MKEAYHNPHSAATVHCGSFRTKLSVLWIRATGWTPGGTGAYIPRPGEDPPDLALYRQSSLFKVFNQISVGEL